MAKRPLRLSRVGASSGEPRLYWPEQDSGDEFPIVMPPLLVGSNEAIRSEGREGAEEPRRSVTQAQPSTQVPESHVHSSEEQMRSALQAALRCALLLAQL